MPKAEFDRLEAAGARFYQWSVPHFFRDTLEEGEVLTRFVTSFATERSEVEAFGQLAA
jgi:threonine aldolase